jgi:hypothetical protein
VSSLQRLEGWRAYSLKRAWDLEGLWVEEAYWGVLRFSG